MILQVVSAPLSLSQVSNPSSPTEHAMSWSDMSIH